MVSTSGCAKADELDLIEHFSLVIEVGDEVDIVADLVEWPRLKGSRVEYPTGSSRFRELCKAKSSIDGILEHAYGYRVQFDYGLTLPLSNLAKSVMNMIGACLAQLNCNFWEVILVCETHNERWAASGSERRITAKDFLEYYAVKYVTTTDGISYKVSRKESFIDAVAREGIELESVLKELEISRFKRVASKDDKVRRSQAKWRMAGKTLEPYEEEGHKRGASSRSVTSDSVDDSSKKRKVTSPTKSQVVLEESDKIAEGADLKPRFEVETGFLEEQRQAKAREKMVAVVDDEFKKLNNLAGKLYQQRYTKAEILAYSKGNYEEEEIMDEEEIEEMEDGLKVAEKTATDNQKTIDQKELDVAREGEEQILFYNVEYAEEYEALISQYEDRLDDNVNLSLKLEEAKSQVEDMTATILSRDLALNQLTNELGKLKEKAASGSRHEAELAEYRIRALNDEISDMKCNIRVQNEQLLKKEIDLDTARTDLAVSEANFEKLNSGIAGKDLELCNSAQLCDSLITRLDRLKEDLRRLKGREAQSRVDLVEVQAKNKSLVDDLAHARGNVKRVVQRDK
ncbi:hypothetical protein GIB67_003330 [Kingdonia uniflora]|uniref:Uncharacterized protein n=1 Tax=Kingdonia uniflora TaxID=39325 RepID=A0A7J7P978_9MAGN|nr:hypothetical protein GIB67_003330 [Kingdonia uniflora]